MIDCVSMCRCHADCPQGCVNCENAICKCRNVDSNPDYLACLDSVEETYVRCLLDCDHETDCLAECVREYEENKKVCPCEENCPNGCPCPQYDCTQTESTTQLATTTPKISKNLVLVLNTWREPIGHDGPHKKYPHLVSQEGGATTGFKFEYGENTGAAVSCAITWRNQFYIFGGEFTDNQVSQVVDCKLKRIGSLTFSHVYGKCANLSDRTIYLCFGDKNTNQCRKSSGPLDQFELVNNSSFVHLNGAMASSESKILRF